MTHTETPAVTDDLLNALRNLAFHAEATCDPQASDMQRGLTRMSIERARLAIAKATGEPA